MLPGMVISEAPSWVRLRRTTSATCAQQLQAARSWGRLRQTTSATRAQQLQAARPWVPPLQMRMRTACVRFMHAPAYVWRHSSGHTCASACACVCAQVHVFAADVSPPTLTEDLKVVMSSAKPGRMMRTATSSGVCVFACVCVRACGWVSARGCAWV